MFSKKTTSKRYSWKDLKREVPALDALEVLAMRIGDGHDDLDGIWELVEAQIRGHVGPYRHRCGGSEPDGEREAFTYSDEALEMARREIQEVLYRNAVSPGWSELDHAAE